MREMKIVYFYVCACVARSPGSARDRGLQQQTTFEGWEHRDAGLCLQRRQPPGHRHMVQEWGQDWL